MSNAISHPTVLSEPPIPAQPTAWALLLDVDGTLLGFKDDPRAVVAEPALRDLLGGLRDALGGALALVSGRSIQDLDRIFGGTGWTAAGIHGLEVRHAGEATRKKWVDEFALTHMRQAAKELVRRFPDIAVEDKTHALALHSRGSQAKQADLLAAARDILSDAGDVEIQPGRQVLELKPAGVNKGTAIVELMAHAPFSGRTAVYVGDDLTDEHAFVRVNEMSGISVRVGHRTPTAAAFCLDDVAATRRWLSRLLLAISEGANPA